MCVFVCEHVQQRREGVGLRIQANALEDSVTDHKIMHVQVLSLSIDFYVRVFVRVYTSAEKVKDSATKQMYVYQSSGCDSFYTQPVGRKVDTFHLITLKGLKIWVMTEAAAPERQQAGKVAHGRFLWTTTVASLILLVLGLVAILGSIVSSLVQ